MSNDALGFAKSFCVNEYGIIFTNGKFEGEPSYAPYFWHLSLEGEGDEHRKDEDFLQFTITDEDRENFQNLGDHRYVSLFEDSQGFVYVDIHNDDRT